MPGPPNVPRHRWLPVALCLLLGLSACTRPPALLDQIKQDGVLRVATRNAPTTYYEGPRGPAGIEYDLITLFAERLGVDVKWIIPDSLDEIIPMVQHGQVHIAAAGLTSTRARRLRVLFGPSYQQITQQVVYRRGTRRPRRVVDLHRGTLDVLAGSSHEERLKALRKRHPQLTWHAQREMSSEELLYQVKEEFIDYTVADSNEVALNRRYYRTLAVAFDLTEPERLAWAFPHSADRSLYHAAIAFFDRIRTSGKLQELLDRYYAHADQLNFVDTRAFMRSTGTRLPDYRALFEKAAEKTGLDWRLLAAMGYQESHWNPHAVSPTGVRGIMMLTRDTARQLGIEDRIDPENSIMGGAHYFKRMLRKIPARITDPDRSWLALAAYNVGFGHLEDARIITQRRGGNPDKWMDVKDNLPLLSQKKWYETVRRGYARGREPVEYVANVRNYFDLLVWMEEREKVEPESLPPVLTVLPPAL